MPKPILSAILLFILQAAAVAQTKDDEFAGLRRHLNVPESTPVTLSSSVKLPGTSPLKVYLAMKLDPKGRAMFAEKVDQWNRKDGAKYGMVKIVPEMSQADLIFARYTVQNKATARSGKPFSAFSYIIVRNPKGLVIIGSQTRELDREIDDALNEMEREYFWGSLKKKIPKNK